jgi:hypothetical protein
MTTTTHRVLAAAAGLGLTATIAACGSASTTTTPVAPAAVNVTSAKDLDAVSFGDPTDVDNAWFPLVPGTRMAWEGEAYDEGELIKRRVVFTVSDLTKMIGDIETRVALDLDYDDGELGEQEIMFFAQDDGGNVWLFGEYPEEYDGAKIDKTPAWIHGFEGAKAGLAMKAEPSTADPDYAQGWGPEVGWNDRAGVDATGEHTCTPVDCYDDVLVMREYSRDELGASQLKFYAEGIGTVRVGWRGPEEEEQEELVLVSVERLSAAEMDELRRTIIDQDERAYRHVPDTYGATAPITAD